MFQENKALKEEEFVPFFGSFIFLIFSILFVIRQILDDCEGEAPKFRITMQSQMRTVSCHSVMHFQGIVTIPQKQRRVCEDGYQCQTMKYYGIGGPMHPILQKEIRRNNGVKISVPSIKRRLQKTEKSCICEGVLGLDF